MKAHWDREAGFSLIEVLVVLVLVSALATTIALTSSKFGKLLRADNQTLSRLALQQTLHHISDLLEQTEDIPILTPSDREPIRNGVLGKPQEVRFVAIARRGALSKGLREITLKVESDSGRGVLVQLMRPRRLETQSVERVELANDIENMSLAYFGLKGDARAPSWHREWLNIDALPIAISVEITIRDGNDLLVGSDIATLSR